MLTCILIQVQVYQTVQFICMQNGNWKSTKWGVQFLMSKAKVKLDALCTTTTINNVSR